MRALRVVWDPRPTAGLQSGFTSARGTDVESLGETIPSQRLVHHQRHASLSPGPVSWPSKETAPKSRLSRSGADHAGVTPALRVALPVRAIRLSCFGRRACRFSIPVRDHGIEGGPGRPKPSGSDAVLTSRRAFTSWTLAGQRREEGLELVSRQSALGEHHPGDAGGRKSR
jgi:hypothetical protein